METLLALLVVVLAAVALRAGVDFVAKRMPAKRGGSRPPSSPGSLSRSSSSPPMSSSPPSSSDAPRRPTRAPHSPPIYLLLEGPEKALILRMDPFATLGRPGAEGHQVKVEEDIYVSLQGLDSQLGVMLLDLWALLGEAEARATLARPVRLLPNLEARAYGAKLGGLQAMEGWMQVPSLASYQPPAPEEFPAVLPVTLQFPLTSLQLFLDRARLLEVAGRRTHPTAAPRGARPEPKGPATDRDRAGEVIATAAARYATNPSLALALLEEAFGPGSIVETMDLDLKMALSQVWGLSLRNAGRIEEALARFTWGLEQAPDEEARQQLSYNRGYARLMGLMQRREAGEGRLVESRIAVDPAKTEDFQACLEDFRLAARLGPEDVDAHSQVALCAQVLAELLPEQGASRLAEAREALMAALALEQDPGVRAALEARLAALG